MIITAGHYRTTDAELAHAPAGGGGLGGIPSNPSVPAGDAERYVTEGTRRGDADY